MRACCNLYTGLKDWVREEGRRVRLTKNGAFEMTEGPVGWGPLGGGLWAHRDQWEGVDLLGGVKQSQRLRKSQVRAEKDPNTNFPVLGGTLLPPQFPKAKAAATQEPRTTTHQILLQCELYMGETNTWERVTGSTSHLRLNGIPTSSTLKKFLWGHL